ncbi:AAA family ATPase [Fervidobacterium pennivorans subsp. shakshaketiis]|uniref:AAA family ATPase n=1 Tax=Fervidobacterium pennivorans TaxID=93466 RepID=UPI00355AFB88
MKLTKVEIANYRQYVNAQFDFENNKNSELHVIVGKMGSGKTTFLEAVNWALFGEEFFSTKRHYGPADINNIETSLDSGRNSSSVPDIGILSKIRLQNDGDYRTYVKLVFVGEKEHLRINRNAKFLVSNGKISPSIEAVPLSVFLNNSPVTVDRELEIQKRFPKDLREHFFFDGESLDVYLKEARGTHIKRTVERLSGISNIQDFTDFLSGVRTKVIYKELRNMEKKGNNRLEEISRKIEEQERTLKELNTRLEEAKQEKEKVTRRLEEVVQKLQSLQDYEQLKSKLEQLESEKQAKIENKKRLISEKLLLTLDEASYLFGWKAVEEFYKFAGTKESSILKELPRPAVERMINEKTCAICGSHLSEELLNILYKSLTSESLVISEEYYNLLKRTIVKNIYQIRILNEQISVVEKEISEIDKNLNELSKNLPNDVSSALEQYQNEKIELERLKENIQQKIYDITNNIKSIQKELEQNKRELQEILESNKSLAIIKRQLEFVQTLEDILSRGLGKLRQIISADITSHTKEYINRVMWKKDIIDSIAFTEEFELIVSDKSGVIQIKELSGGERSILTLALALAIHKTAGVSIPIFIDRPLTNISGESYYELIELLSRFSEERQIIITMTDREYDDLKERLVKLASTVHYLNTEKKGDYYITTVERYL